MKEKLNGYAQWIVIAVALGSIIWSASSVNSKVKELETDIRELKISHKIELELLRDEIKELKLELRVFQNKYGNEP
jgi:outer membrane murein-binding lipoprotein Lpp